MPANPRTFPATLLCLALLSTPAHAETTYLRISAGTGFVINPNGNVVTNAHVVRGCQSIAMHTEHGDLPATLVASDTDHDLAVLNVPGLSATPMAPMRWNISDLKIGDAVTMIGFPGQEGVDGHYTVKKTTVKSLEGPTGEPLWIQLESVAQHGNSGGPVLDSGGNVIGVISAMTQTYRVAQDGHAEPELVSSSDVAITLSTLQDFLRRNSVGFYESSSGLVAYSDNAIEDQALKFIVPVRCVQGTVVK